MNSSSTTRTRDPASGGSELRRNERSPVLLSRLDGKLGCALDAVDKRFISHIGAGRSLIDHLAAKASGTGEVHRRAIFLSPDNPENGPIVPVFEPPIRPTRPRSRPTARHVSRLWWRVRAGPDFIFRSTGTRSRSTHRAVSGQVDGRASSTRLVERDGGISLSDMRSRRSVEKTYT